MSPRDAVRGITSYQDSHVEVAGKLSLGSSVTHLLHFCLQVAQLHALLQVFPMLFCRQVQLLLLFMKKFQEVLDPSGHVHISVAKQLHTCEQWWETLVLKSHWSNSPLTNALPSVVCELLGGGRRCTCPALVSNAAFISSTPGWERVHT